MSFKLPGVPSARADVHELADFTELECWKKGRVSVTEIASLLGRIEEVDYSEGVSEQDEGPILVEEVYAEVDQRCKACGDGYPFAIEQTGYILTLQEDGRDNARRFIYRYLLLATRLRMDKSRKHADIDGALLFEYLAAEVARTYFGRAVFGTAAGNGGIRARLNFLCKRMGEGGGCGPHVDAHSKDAKLDVVAWKSFRDGLPGKMIAFGQCKTGTDWRNQLAQLQPDVFCDQLRNPPVLTPVRMFFVAEAPDRSRWRSVAKPAGLLFDRCRIVEFSSGMCRAMVDKVTAWTKGAAAVNGLPDTW